MSARLIIGRHKRTPVDLFRIQSSFKPQPREYHRQRSQQQIAYDYQIQPDGMIHPATGLYYQRPNGIAKVVRH
jgi:hypothetical protein